MKKLILTLSIMCCLGFYSYGQATYVVEDGVTYTRIVTKSELNSLGGMLSYTDADASAKRKYSGSFIACKKGNGCCLGGRLTVDVDGSDQILGITIPAQTLDDGTTVPSDMSGVFAYYNAEIDAIIFRVYTPAP